MYRPRHTTAHISKDIRLWNNMHKRRFPGVRNPTPPIQWSSLPLSSFPQKRMVSSPHCYPTSHHSLLPQPSLLLVLFSLAHSSLASTPLCLRILYQSCGRGPRAEGATSQRKPGACALAPPGTPSDTFAPPAGRSPRESGLRCAPRNVGPPSTLLTKLLWPSPECASQESAGGIAFAEIAFGSRFSSSLLLLCESVFAGGGVKIVMLPAIAVRSNMYEGLDHIFFFK